jgi:hypothetical protein
LGTLLDKNRKIISRGKWKDGKFESSVKGSDEIRLKEVETKAEAYNSQSFSTKKSSGPVIVDRKKISTQEIKTVSKGDVKPELKQEIKIQKKEESNAKDTKPSSEIGKDKEKSKKKQEESELVKELKDSKKEVKKEKKPEETTREASKKKVKKIDVRDD